MDAVRLSLRSRSKTSYPSISGNIRSSTIRSGRSALAAFSAPGPLHGCRYPVPGSTQVVHEKTQDVGSSSTTRMCSSFLGYAD